MVYGKRTIYSACDILKCLFSADFCSGGPRRKGLCCYLPRRTVVLSHVSGSRRTCEYSRQSFHTVICNSDTVPYSCPGRTTTESSVCLWHILSPFIWLTTASTVDRARSSRGPERRQGSTVSSSRRVPRESDQEVQERRKCGLRDPSSGVADHHFLLYL